MFAHGLTILIGLLAVIGEIGLGLDGSSSKFRFNKVSDFDDIVETRSDKAQVDPWRNHREIKSRSPNRGGWNREGDESGYYHVGPRKVENDKPKTYNCSSETSPQVEHFTCDQNATGANAERNYAAGNESSQDSTEEPAEAASTDVVKTSSSANHPEHGDVCNLIYQILRNPIVERLLMNTMYKSPKPAEKWSTFVFIVRKMEPNTPEGVLEHPKAKECIERFVRKRRRKRHSTATVMRRKQKMIKRLQRRDTLDKEDNLFKDIAKFLVSNKLKHNGYTYVPVMFSHQSNDRLAGFSAHDLNGDFGLKFTDLPSTSPSSTKGEKVGTEGVNIHAGGSMVPGILIYPVAKKLKRFPLDKSALENFLPTYTLPVLKRGVPPECAEDTEKLLQLLETAKHKDNPPRRMIPGILVYPLSKDKRFILGGTNMADSSVTEDGRPTFYPVDRNVSIL
nr:unnamed protein product [Callosobruchus analis]